MNVIRVLLILLRAQLVAIVATVDAALAIMTTPDESATDPTTCEHPPAKRQPLPVGGNLDQFLCRACNRIIGGKEAAVNDGA